MHSLSSEQNKEKINPETAREWAFPGRQTNPAKKITPFSGFRSNGW